MKQHLSTVLVAALVASVVSVLVGGLVGGQSANLGAAIGVTRYPNSGIASRGLRVSTSTTPSTPADGALEVTGAVSFSQVLTVLGLTTLSGPLQVDNIRYGGAAATITASTTMTATAANVCDNSILLVGTQAASSTLTLPGSAALIADCISLRGAVKTLRIKNTSTSASDVVLAAGDASTTIRFPAGNASTTSPVGLTIPINQIDRVTFIAASTTSGLVDIEVEKFVQ